MMNDVQKHELDIISGTEKVHTLCISSILCITIVNKIKFLHAKPILLKVSASILDLQLIL